MTIWNKRPSTGTTPQYNNEGRGPIYGQASVMPDNVPWNKPMGKDTVPAMLSPNEYVVNSEATQMFGPQIHAMNEAGLAARRGEQVPSVPAPMQDVPSMESLGMGNAPISEYTTKDRHGNTTTIKYDTKAAVPQQYMAGGPVNAGPVDLSVAMRNEGGPISYRGNGGLWGVLNDWFEPDENSVIGRQQRGELLPAHIRATPPGYGAEVPVPAAEVPQVPTGRPFLDYDIAQEDLAFAQPVPQGQPTFYPSDSAPDMTYRPDASQAVQGGFGVPAIDEALIPYAPQALVAAQDPMSDEALLLSSSESKVDLAGTTIDALDEVPPKPVQTTSTDLIADFEGFRDQAYQDSTGVWTIGFGRTTNPDGSPIQPGQTTTQEAELPLFNSRVRQDEEYVVNYMTEKGYNINPNQLKALTSFTYNLGPGGLDQLTAGGTRSMDEIAAAIPLYNKAGGEFSQGLQNRRDEELALFSNTGAIERGDTYAGQYDVSSGVGGLTGLGSGADPFGANFRSPGNEISSLDEIAAQRLRGNYPGQTDHELYGQVIQGANEDGIPVVNQEPVGGARVPRIDGEFVSRDETFTYPDSAPIGGARTPINEGGEFTARELTYPDSQPVGGARVPLDEFVPPSYDHLTVPPAGGAVGGARVPRIDGEFVPREEKIVFPDGAPVGGARTPIVDGEFEAREFTYPDAQPVGGARTPVDPETGEFITREEFAVKYPDAAPTGGAVGAKEEVSVVDITDETRAAATNAGINLGDTTTVDTETKANETAALIQTGNDGLPNVKDKGLKEELKGVGGKVEGFLKGAFGSAFKDLFGSGDIGQIIAKSLILYAGGRLTGMSGNQALAFAAKSALAAGSAEKAQLAKRKAWANKGLDPANFTTESIDKYIESGNPKDLVSLGASAIQFGDSAGYDVYVGGYGKLGVFHDAAGNGQYVDRGDGIPFPLNTLRSHPGTIVQKWDKKWDPETLRSDLAIQTEKVLKASGIDLETLPVNSPELANQLTGEIEKIMRENPSITPSDLRTQADKAIRQYAQAARFNPAEASKDLSTFLRANMISLDLNKVSQFADSDPETVLDLNSNVNTFVNGLGLAAKEAGQEWTTEEKADADNEVWAQFDAAWSLVNKDKKAKKFWEKAAKKSEPKKSPYVYFVDDFLTNPTTGPAVQFINDNNEKIDKITEAKLYDIYKKKR